MIVTRSGQSAGRIGFGVSGPHAGMAVPPRKTIDLVHKAVALGIRIFDTGPSYGAGAAERRLGQAVSGMSRDDIFISTKVGTLPGGRKDFSPKGIEASLQASLWRLGLSFIDVLFLHGPAVCDLTPQLLDFLSTLKRDGLVRYLGIAGRGAELGHAVQTGGFDIMMAPAGLFIDARGRSFLEMAKKENMALWGIEVLGAASAPWRWPQSRADLWYLARAIKRQISQGGAGVQHSNPAASVRTCLHNALCNLSVDVVLSTSTRLNHLQEMTMMVDELTRTS